MCGIAGFIGESKLPDVSFQLINKLFEHLEVRGKDAAGFWGTQAGDGKTLYHKEPGRPSAFVKKQVWKDVSKLNPNVLLVHAREASQGVGLPSTNKNNHPFVNSDLSVGLCHNGRIPQNVYEELVKKYEVRTNCDSELLLRIFESGHLYEAQDIETEFSEEDATIASRLMGLRDIWSSVFRAHMAVAIGERLSEGGRRLWLFRNDYRTLWVADARDQLGQIFFVSTPEIWQAAIFDCPAAWQVLSKSKVPKYDLTPEEIWCFEINKERPIVTDEGFHKFVVEQSGEYEPWKPDGKKIAAGKINLSGDVYTELDENEEIKGGNAPNLYEYGELCYEMRNILGDIEMCVNRQDYKDEMIAAKAMEELRKARNTAREARRILYQ